MIVEPDWRRKLLVEAPANDGDRCLSSLEIAAFTKLNHEEAVDWHEGAKNEGRWLSAPDKPTRQSSVDGVMLSYASTSYMKYVRVALSFIVSSGRRPWQSTFTFSAAHGAEISIRLLQ